MASRSNFYTQALPTACLPYPCKTSSGLLHNMLLVIESDLPCSNVFLCPWWHCCKLPQLCYLGTCTQAEECCWYVKSQASVVSIATMQEPHLNCLCTVMSLDCRRTFTSCRHQSQMCHPACFWRYHSSNWGRNCCGVDLGAPGTTTHIRRWNAMCPGLNGIVSFPC